MFFSLHWQQSSSVFKVFLLCFSVQWLYGWFLCLSLRPDGDRIRQVPSFRRSESFKECGNGQPGRQVSEVGAPALASPITDLCNLSISLSSFPDDCKTAKLKPLYKKEAKTKPTNRRSISLLPLTSKVIEKVIHNQTQNFSDTNMILYNYQSGFGKHCSTDTCLSYLTDKVRTGFEKGLLTAMVLINLQEVFDTIDHGILPDKMNCLGFSNSTVTWFNSYLTNRSFIVTVGKEYSSPGKLTCGVPLGSSTFPSVCK